MRKVLFTLVAMGLLMAFPAGRAEAATINFYFDLASWTTAANAAGRTTTLEDFNAYPNGPIGSFSVGGVNFNSPVGTISAGTLVSDFKVGPDYPAGSISGALLYGFGFESVLGKDVLGGQAFAIDGFNLNTGIQTTFFGVLSDTPLRSIRMQAFGIVDVGLGLNNPGAGMDNMRVATSAVPEPLTLFSLGASLAAMAALRLLVKRA